MITSFNPAEAREGFKRLYQKKFTTVQTKVSIQPKPEKGLKVNSYFKLNDAPRWRFNPAEAREGFKSIRGDICVLTNSNRFNPAEAREGFKRKMNCALPMAQILKFQSSRSQRRV